MKEIVVTYTFYLPEHQEQLEMAQKGPDYFCALHEIDRICRHQKKYVENPSEDSLEMANKILEIMGELEIY